MDIMNDQAGSPVKDPIDIEHAVAKQFSEENAIF